MADKPLETYKFDVVANDQKMTVIVPKSDDEPYDKYIIEAEKEKTKDYLNRRKRQPEKPGARYNLVEAIKEQQDYRRRKSQSVNKKYF